MSAQEWPMEAPLVLDGLLGPPKPTTIHRPVPGTYAFPKPSREQLAICQERINELAPAQAVLAVHAVAEYLHAAYRQYEAHWDGWGLYRATRRWRGKGGVRIERGDFVLAVHRPNRDNPRYPGEDDWSAFCVRGGCDVATSRWQLSPV